MRTYRVTYSTDAKEDLKDIYSDYLYISKKVATDQVKRIREEIRTLNTMPERYSLADFEPLRSRQVRRFSVKNHVVFYFVNNDDRTVTIMRIIYGRRDMEKIDWTS